MTQGLPAGMRCQSVSLNFGAPNELNKKAITAFPVQQYIHIVNQLTMLQLNL